MRPRQGAQKDNNMRVMRRVGVMRTTVAVMRTTVGVMRTALV